MPGLLTCAGGWRDDGAAGYRHFLAELALGRPRVRVRPRILPASARPPYPRSDPRWTVLIAELSTVPRIHRPLWVVGSS
jgi:hypothetical protein